MRFYIIDAEILFSRTPFLKTNTEEFSYVKPCHVEDIVASSGDDVSVHKINVKVPEKLKM